MLYEDYEKLKKLEEALKNGTITQEEFENEKSKILSGEKKQESSQAVQPRDQALLGLDENVYLLLMHLSQLVTAFIIPIIMWAVGKNDSPKVDLHGKNIINFQISVIVWIFIGIITSIIGIGIIILLVIGIAVTVTIIIASIKAYNGEDWTYPLTIKFLK